MQKFSSGPAALRRLLVLFFKHPFPFFPVVDAAGQIMGLIRQGDVVAALNRGAAADVAELMRAGLGRVPTPAELEELAAAWRPPADELPLLGPGGEVAGYRRRAAGPLPCFGAPAAGWPLALEFDRRGTLLGTGEFVPPEWAPELARGRGRPLRRLAHRLGTALARGARAGWFQRRGRRYRFIAEHTDHGGIVRIEPLLDPAPLLAYLRAEQRGVADLLDYLEREILTAARAAGDAAAREVLRLPRQTLHDKLKKYL